MEIPKPEVFEKTDFKKLNDESLGKWIEHKRLKTIIRIPTDQYAYVEVEMEGSSQEVKDKYDELVQTMKNEASPNDFYSFLCEIINSDLQEWGNSEDYESLTYHQKGVMQALKRLYKRLQYAKDN